MVRALRYRLVVPVMRSPHPPEFTARGVANGVFWALTPSVGVQSIFLLATWFIGGRVLRRESSLLQAFIWAWVNNPITMLPMYYVFFLTGVWLTGDLQRATSYAAFVAIWDQAAHLGWLDRIGVMARAVGVPAIVGCVPYAVIGSTLAYRWSRRLVERRRFSRTL
jgi:uncharacterized protein (DUF2062 family)